MEVLRPISTRHDVRRPKHPAGDLRNCADVRRRSGTHPGYRAGGMSPAVGNGKNGVDERLVIVNNLLAWEMVYALEHDDQAGVKRNRMAVVVRPPAGLPQERKPQSTGNEQAGSAPSSPKPSPAPDKTKPTGALLRRV